MCEGNDGTSVALITVVAVKQASIGDDGAAIYHQLRLLSCLMLANIKLTSGMIASGDNQGRAIVVVVGMLNGLSIQIDL